MSKFRMPPGGPGIWHPTASQVREAIQDRSIISPARFDLFPHLVRYAPDVAETERIINECVRAISAGRLIDFGAWTDEVLIHGGNRGHPMYVAGAINHPFSEPYVFIVRSGAYTEVFMIDPQPPISSKGGEIVSMEGIILENSARCLLIGDRVRLVLEDDGEIAHCPVPAAWRPMSDPEAIEAAGETAWARCHCSLMTAMLILATRGIERTTITASDKLQKARAKCGKLPIPPYDTVDCRGYVTVIENRVERGRREPQRGRHASPISHLRMGHPRRLDDSRTTWVRDAIVNASDEAKATFRSHYTVRQTVDH
jgi:hypothetical protein